MRDYKATSDLLSDIYYESIDRISKGYKTATDVVRRDDHSFWSESVHQEVNAWYDSECKRVITEAGYTEEEWKRLEDEDTEAWYAQIEKNWDEYQESMKDRPHVEVIHMDDDTEPEDCE